MMLPSEINADKDKVRIASVGRASTILPGYLDVVSKDRVLTVLVVS